MKKVSLLVLFCLSLNSYSASATGIGYWPWYGRVSGTVQNQGRAVDLRDEMGLGNSASHGWLVDDGWLQLSYMPMDFAGSGQLSSDATFGGASFSSDANVQTQADFTDLGARFLWFPWRDLGLGLAVKILDGEIVVSEEGGASDSDTISEIFPLATVSYSTDLLQLMRLNLDAGYIAFEKNWALELSAGLEIAAEPMRIRLGWHQKQYDVTNGESAMDARVGGLYAQLIFML